MWKVWTSPRTLETSYVVLGDYTHSPIVGVPQIRRHIESMAYYGDPSVIHDVVLLKLVEGVAFNDYVRPICIPRASNNSRLEETRPAFGILGETARFGRQYWYTVTDELETYGRAPPDDFQAPYDISENMFCLDGDFIEHVNRENDVIDVIAQGVPIMQDIKKKWHIMAVNSLIIDTGARLDKHLYISMDIKYYATWIKRTASI